MSTVRPIKRVLALLIGTIVMIAAVLAGGAYLLVRYTPPTGQATVEGYSADELYRKASALVQTGGDGVLAETYLEAALKQQDDGSYRTQLAVVKYRLGKYSESIEQYQLLLKKNQDSAFAYNGMGNAYRDWSVRDPAQSSERHDQAIAMYKLALVKDPKYVATYANLAQVLWDDGLQSEAVSVLDSGISATGRKELSELKSNLLQR